MTSGFVTPRVGGMSMLGAAPPHVVPAVAMVAGVLMGVSAAPAVELRLSAPVDYQVAQRTSPGRGSMRVVGELSEACPAAVVVEARLVRGDAEPAWQRIGGTVRGRALSGTVTGAAGGWWRLDVRVVHEGAVCAVGSVPHVGIGEVFVVVGQSNSANHGEERQVTTTGRVASFDGTAWRIANDPQPGASGSQGSFMPALGDELVRRLDVPVGFIARGIGATSVREWLPRGERFPHPPTIESRVTRLPDGTWSSDGAAYTGLVGGLRAAGPHGVRAVLWHQGESDANQKDASRTLPGTLYREYLERIIRASRQDAGWEVPWFVAQASYHVPGDEKSDDIRAAQAAVVNDGSALAGPDTDALRGSLRERDGQGVHFSGPGLREHGRRWAERILPWLDAE